MTSGKKLYPEYKQSVNAVILEKYWNQIDKDLKECLEKIVKIWFYDYLNCKDNNIILEKIFSKEKLEKIKQEYYKYARKVLKEDKENIDKFFKIKNEQYSYEILHSGKVINFLKLFNNTIFIKNWFIEKEINNFNTREKEEILKYISRKNWRRVLKYIEKYWIENKKILIDIINNIAVFEWELISLNIKHYWITDKKLILEIAKIIGKNKWRSISKYIKNYWITNQNELIEIAKIAANNDWWWVSKYIQNYWINDQNELIEIAKIAANNNWWWVSKYIQNYWIDDQNELIEIAKIAANNNWWWVSEYIKNYWINDQNELIEIAKIAANNNWIVTSLYIQNYWITNIKALKEIAKISIINNINTLFYLQNYWLWPDINIDKFDTTEDLINFVNNLSEKILSSEKKKIINAYWSNSRLENIKYLLKIIFFEDDEKLIWYSYNDYKKKQQAYFLEYFWFDNNFIKEFINNKNITKKLYEDFIFQCYSIVNIVWIDLFKNIHIDLELVKNNNIKKISKLIRNIKSIIEISNSKEDKINKDFWRSIINTLNNLLNKNNKKVGSIKNQTLKELDSTLLWISSNINKNFDKSITITEENIDFINTNLEKIFTTLFRMLFKLEKTDITKKNLEKLENVWWDITILKILLSRFISKWNIESIPVLAKVIEILLTKWYEWFKNFKYHWEWGELYCKKQSEKQLKYMTKEQISKWKENPYTFKILHSDEINKISEENSLKKWKIIFLNNLFNERHLDRIDENLISKVEMFERSKNYDNEIFTSIKSILSNEIKHPEKIKKEIYSIEKFKNITKKERTKIILLNILYLSRNLWIDNITFHNIVNLLNSGLKWIDLSWIKEDLKLVKNEIKINKENDLIIFSTIFDDPKLLLEIWELTTSFSCLSYETWEKIGALLWYVIDANVKGSASFVIDLSHFNWDKKKFKNIIESIENKTANIKIDYPKRLLIINWTEIKLNKAIARKIIKMWFKWVTPEIFSEKLYHTTHIAKDYITNELDKLIDDYAKDMWIKHKKFWILLWKHWISIVWSKNPLWIYSDAFYSVRKWDYIV